MTKSVRDAMTEDRRSIGTSASVVEAAGLMREAPIGSLPMTGELVEALSEPSDAERR